MAKSRPTLFQQLQEESVPPAQSSANWRISSSIRAAIIVCTPVICALFFPSLSHVIFGTSQSVLLTKGQVWQQETVIAESSFPIRKEEQELQRDLQRVRTNVPTVFARAAQTFSAERIDTRADELLADLGSAAPATRESLRELMISILKKEMLPVSITSLSGPTICIAESETALRYLPKQTVVDSASIQAQIERILSSENKELYGVVERRILSGVQPTLRLQEELTRRLLETAEASVSRTRGLVRKGEVIVSKGEVLSEATIAKLINYGYVRDDSSRNTPHLSYVIGSLLHAALVYSLLMLFVFFLRKKIYNDNLQLLSLSALIAASAAFSWITLLPPREFSIEFLVLIPACAMVAAIYFDSRTGFIVTVTSSLMYAAVRANDAGGALALIIAGTLGAYSVRDLRTRTQLFRSIGFILIGFVLVITAMVLERGGSVTEQWRAYSWAVVNAVVSPLLTFAVIAVTERYFGVMTDLTLREYDNVNHPLLVQMSEKAPGTYQHTLAIAHLVESAAYSIEASPLLARVGAYYHDVGKIAKSEYFIENQIEIDNKHDRLSPKKSASIIRNHVADGIEIAREYRLPEKIVDFIPMHHGTGLIKHFYAKAMEAGAGESPEEITEEMFRYPGPKPQTKETALVMLADGVEAVSRTVDDRDALEHAVDAIFKEKILDGQLDECEITMRELALVRDSFVRNLIGAHHQRMVYKELPKDGA